MFNQEQLNVYKNIHAPNELRQKVLEKSKTSRQTHSSKIAKLTTLVACIVLTLCIISVYNLFDNSTEITIDGMSPIKNDVVLQGTNSVSLATARELEIITVPINVKPDKKTIISVSCGTIIANDAHSGELLMTDTEYSFDKGTNFLWQIPENELKSSNTLTVKSKNKTYVFSLVYDKATNTRTVSCLKK